MGFDADPTPPSQRKIVHGRTVTDPLEDYWETDLLPLLEKDSALQAISLLRHLQSAHPLAFPDDRIRRTLERRMRQWRALSGPERCIIFRQTPEPGYMGPFLRKRGPLHPCRRAGRDDRRPAVPAPALSLRDGLQPPKATLGGGQHVGVFLGGESFTALAENLQQAL